GGQSRRSGRRQARRRQPPPPELVAARRRQDPLHPRQHPIGEPGRRRRPRQGAEQLGERRFGGVLEAGLLGGEPAVQGIFGWSGAGHVRGSLQAGRQTYHWRPPESRIPHYGSPGGGVSPSPRSPAPPPPPPGGSAPGAGPPAPGAGPPAAGAGPPAA